MALFDNDEDKEIVYAAYEQAMTQLVVQRQSTLGKEVVGVSDNDAERRIGQFYSIGNGQQKAYRRMTDDEKRRVAGIVLEDQIIALTEEQVTVLAGIGYPPSDEVA